MARGRVRLRRTLDWQLGLLGLQWLLGMAINLWVAIPPLHPGAHAADYFVGLMQGLWWALIRSNPLLKAHIGLGLVVWLLSIMLIVQAFRLRRASLIWATIIGWVGLTGAGFNGGSFLNYGHNLSSMLMAVGFALAATGYVWARDQVLRIDLSLPEAARQAEGSA